MAHYNYKRVRDLLPDDFRERFKQKYEQEFDDDWNYNGDGKYWRDKLTALIGKEGE